MPKLTPEGLIEKVIAADDLRRKARGQPSTRAALALGRRRPFFEHFFISPLFNALGLACGQIMMILPAALQRPFVQWLNCKMGHYVPHENSDLPKRIEETVRLAQELKQKTGQWPALLILTSHPETEGPLHWLRFELLREGLLIADAVVEARRPGAWYPRRPRCFVAIDPFALDTVSPSAGAFYAGWMHRTYLAWDRQPSTQSWIQKHMLLSRSGYAHVASRLLWALKRDAPVLMVLSGGLPYNTRLLYAAREFVQRLPIQRWAVPKRRAQIELMELLMTPEGDVWPADQGVIPQGKQGRVRDAMTRWGLSAERVEESLREFMEEFKLEVPYRARLFGVLRSRLVRKGKALIVVRIDHRGVAPHVRISVPGLLLLACLLLCNGPARALDGVWKGQVHRRAVYETSYHRAVYEEELELTLRAQGRTVTGQGSAYLTDPAITRIRNHKLYAEWTASYQPSEFDVTVNGYQSGQGARDVVTLTVQPVRRVRVHFNYRDGEGAKINDWLELPHLVSVRIPANPRRTEDFSFTDPLPIAESANLPPDLLNFGEAIQEAQMRTSGGFQEIKPPARRLSARATLALFLSYLILILPGLIAIPASVAYLSALGTLLGALPALQSLGLGWSAQILRGSGWGAAALILVLESRRVHRAGQAAGKKFRRTAAAVLICALLNSLAFAGAFQMMAALLRLFLASSLRIGPAAKAGAGLAGALLTTYAVAWTLHAVQRRGVRSSLKCL